MQVEILSGPPVSGTIREHWFNARGSCTWARFNGPGGEEWAGVFGEGGSTRYRAAVLFNEQRDAFVVAGGQGYVVDLSARRLRYMTPCDYHVGVIAVPRRDLVIAAGFTDLYAYSSAGPEWRSDRVALDGIHFEAATPDALTGHVWQGEAWHEFRLDLRSWRLVQGRAVSDNWLAFDGGPTAT